MLTNSTFHRRIFGFLAKAFKKQGLEVTGSCRLLDEPEIVAWIRDKKPDTVFEMNRDKDEIPVLHELGVVHIAWVVDSKAVENRKSRVATSLMPLILVGWIVLILEVY